MVFITPWIRSRSPFTRYQIPQTDNIPLLGCLLVKDTSASKSGAVVLRQRRQLRETFKKGAQFDGPNRFPYIYPEPHKQRLPSLPREKFLAPIIFDSLPYLQLKKGYPNPY
jgi:hypothetical protein